METAEERAEVKQELITLVSQILEESRNFETSQRSFNDLIKFIKKEISAETKELLPTLQHFEKFEK